MLVQYLNNTMSTHNSFSHNLHYIFFIFFAGPVPIDSLENTHICVNCHSSWPYCGLPFTGNSGTYTTYSLFSLQQLPFVNLTAPLLLMLIQLAVTQPILPIGLRGCVTLCSKLSGACGILPLFLLCFFNEPLPSHFSAVHD